MIGIIVKLVCWWSDPFLFLWWNNRNINDQIQASQLFVYFYILHLCAKVYLQKLSLSMLVSKVGNFEMDTKLHK